MTTPGLTMCRVNQTNTHSLYENLYASASTTVIFTGKLTVVTSVTESKGRYVNK